MRLTFLGTRGAHVPAGNGHIKHSALLLEVGGQKLMFDCGSDWRGQLKQLQPDTVFISHAHDDHAGGLDDSYNGPLWASDATWKARPDLIGPTRQTFEARVPLQCGDCGILPWPVVHSFRAPTVAFRISCATTTLFYAPDIASLPDADIALDGVDLYIGDGAALDASLLRVEQDQLCGHASLPQQLAWCIAHGVPRMLISHCGAVLVSPQHQEALAPLQQYAAEQGIRLEVAEDGLELKLP